jgi:hypothetical protein
MRINSHTLMPWDADRSGWNKNAYEDNKKDICLVSVRGDGCVNKQGREAVRMSSSIVAFFFFSFCALMISRVLTTTATMTDNDYP